MVANNEILRVLCCGVKSRDKYTPLVRQFCLSIHYHSPRAYNYLRKTFNKHLPHPLTIQKWYANSEVSGEPGIQANHIDKLKKIVTKHQEKFNTKMVCTLIADEMSLRQQIFWSPKQNSYEGFISKQSNDGSRKFAKQAFVYMLNGVNCNFEFPVCYWLIDSIDGDQRRQCMLDVLKAVTSAGVVVKFLVFDGCPSNFTMSAHLLENNGAILGPDQLITSFKNPQNDENVYIFPDPCHMAKLLRKALATKIIIDKNGSEIKWSYIESLYEYSQKNDFNVHKLCKKHINWGKNPMNVRLATQTLSNSVADAMEFLRKEGHPSFSGAAATIDFLRKCNTAFDIFNSRNQNQKNIFKNAMNTNNKRVIVDFLERLEQYFKTLGILTKKNEIKPILSSRSKTAFSGLIICSRSLIQFYDEYVEKNKIISEIPTYNLQQDPIEMLFGQIRSKNGFNNNPNIQQFKGAFRKVLCNIKIEPSEFGNCRVFNQSLPIDYLFSSVFTTTSRRPQISFMDIKDKYEEQHQQILEAVYDISCLESNEPLLDATTNYRIAYVASSIENNLRNRFECDDCMTVFDKDPKISTIELGAKAMPCRSTFKICQHADNFLKLHDIRKEAENQIEFDFRVSYCLIFRTLDINELYKNSNFVCGINHKYSLIKSIILQYVSVKGSYLSQQITLDQYTEICRQHYNKLTIFRGQ